MVSAATKRKQRARLEAERVAREQALERVLHPTSQLSDVTDAPGDLEEHESGEETRQSSGSALSHAAAAKSLSSTDDALLDGLLNRLRRGGLAAAS